VTATFIDSTFSTKDSTANNTYTHTGMPSNQAGDLLLWTVQLGSTTAASTPSGWTQVLTVARSTDPSSVYLYWKISSGSETDPSVTQSAAGSGRHYSTLQSFRGVNQVSPIGASTSSNDTSATTRTSWTLPTITTGQDDELVVCMVTNAVATSPAWTWTNATEIADDVFDPASSTTFFSHTMATIVQATAGTTPSNISASRTGTATNFWASYVVEIKTQDATKTAADTGSSAEAATVRIQSSEAGAAADSSPVISFNPHGADTLALSDVASAGELKPGSDTGSSSESAVAVPATNKAASDTGSGSDSATVRVFVLSSARTARVQPENRTYTVGMER
jgi:hypothetical protein